MKRKCSIEKCEKEAWVRNVYWHKQNERWHVQVTKDKKKYSFGLYDDLEEAAEVARKAREELFGEFAGKG